MTVFVRLLHTYAIFFIDNLAYKSHILYSKYQERNKDTKIQRLLTKLKNQEIAFVNKSKKNRSNAD